MAMPIFILSLALVFAVFLATLWNAGEVATATGRKRFFHIAITALIIALLAFLGLGAPEWLARGAGVALAAVTLWMGLTERGRACAYCLIQMVFGGVVAAGLPYAVI